MVYAAPELGIGPKVSTLTVAERVEMLLDNNRFLDAPYVVSAHHKGG